MRISSFICAIIVLVLNFVPCADAHEKLDVKISVSATTSNDVHKNPIEDACTPFCHCSCCASSLIIKNTLSLIARFPQYHNYSIHYIEGNNSHADHSIWQPPRII